MSDAADFQQALQQFRADYARQLPQRFDEARALLQACRRDPADDAALRGLHRVVHKLAGTAGTFGFASLSTLARELEEQLEPLLARTQRVAADFEPFVERLEALARQAGPLP